MNSHHQVSGIGTGMSQVDGTFAGPLYQKLPRPVVNSSTVDAGKGVEVSANVSRQHCPLPLWWIMLTQLTFQFAELHHCMYCM